MAIFLIKAGVDEFNLPIIGENQRDISGKLASIPLGKAVAAIVEIGKGHHLPTAITGDRIFVAHEARQKFNHPRLKGSREAGSGAFRCGGDWREWAVIFHLR